MRLHTAERTVTAGENVTLGLDTADDFTVQYTPGAGGTVGIKITAKEDPVDADFIAITGSPFNAAGIAEIDQPARFIRIEATTADANAALAGPSPFHEESAPTFGAAAIADQSGYTTHPLTPLKLPRPTGGVGDIVLTIAPALPAGLVFDALDGEIFGSPSAAQAQTAHTLTATDEQADTGTVVFNLTVVANTALGIAAVRADVLWHDQAAQDVTLPAGTGGNGAITVKLEGDLPPGVTFDAATRELTKAANPLGALPRKLTYVVTDATGQVFRQSFLLEILAHTAPYFPVDELHKTAVLEGVVMRDIEIPRPKGGFGDLTWSHAPPGSDQNPPAGTQFEEAYLRISGTPVYVTDRIILIFATDEANQKATLRVPFQVINHPPVFSDKSFQQVDAVENVELSWLPPEVTGGDGTLVYSHSGTLPAGLTLNTATGEISGTAHIPVTEENAEDHTLTVTDDDSETDTVLFAVVVANNPPVFSGPGIISADATKGVAFSWIPPEVTGGDGTLVYSYSGVLPDGLALNAATGEISGTPTTVILPTNVDYSQFIVTDGDNETDSVDVGIAVAANPPVFASDFPLNIIFGVGVVVNYAGPIVNGGVAPIVWTISPTLPAGLVISASTGSITGTPTAAAAAEDHTYTVTDDDGDTDTRIIQITVAA